MLYYKQFKNQVYVPEIIGNKKKFDNTIYTFDIETTSFYTYGNKIYCSSEYLKLTKKQQEECEFRANMYIWMFGINDVVYFGRTWEEFLEFIKMVDSNSVKNLQWLKALSSDKNIEYELYASTLTAGYNFALLSETEDNKITIKEICTAYRNKDNDGNKFQSCYEVSSGYVYSLVKKHWSLISEEANRFAKSIYEENQSTEKITEYVVQSFTSQLLAFFCIFDFDLIRNDEEWYTAVYNAISQAFLIKNVDNFLSLTEEYQSNREKYPDFESFFVNYIPEAIKSF